MKLNKLQQAIAGVVIVILVAFFGHFVILKKDRTRIVSTESKNVQLRKDINVAKAIQKSAAELQEEMIHLKAQLERLKKILPQYVNEPRFLADLKRYANENGIEITKVVHNKPITRDVIVEHPFNFHTRGNYNDYGRFFSQLSGYQRIISVKALHLERLQGSKNYSVDSKFVLSIYTYKEPTEEELREQVEAKKKAKQRDSKAKKKKRR